MSQTTFEFDGALWVTLAELARRKNVARPTIGERVKRLAESNKITIRKEGRNKLVNLAEYDDAVGQVGDAIKENAATVPDDTGNKTLRDAQAQQAQYKSELLRIELEREEGKTRSVQEIEKAAVLLAQALVRETEKFSKYAEEIGKAAGGKDMRSARLEGKKVAHKLREIIYQKLSALPVTEKPHVQKTVSKSSAKTKVNHVS